MNFLSSTQSRIKSKFNRYNVEITFVDRSDNILFANKLAASNNNASSKFLDGFYSSKAAEMLRYRIKRAFKRQTISMMANTSEGLKKIYFIPKLDCYDGPIGVWIIALTFDHESDEFVDSLTKDLSKFAFPELEREEKKKYEYKHSFAYYSMK